MPSSRRSQKLIMGTGQLRQGMIHLLVLLKAWHPCGMWTPLRVNYASHSLAGGSRLSCA